MVKKGIKSEKKTRRKYKKKRGGGFGDGFKFLYSLGKKGVNRYNKTKKKLCNDET